MHSFFQPVVSLAKPRYGHDRAPVLAGAWSWPALLRAIACGDAISALPRSVNHRLISFKPPACFSATIQNSERY
jgi:hypothetical protein